MLKQKFLRYVMTAALALFVSAGASAQLVFGTALPADETVPYGTKPVYLFCYYDYDPTPTLPILYYQWQQAPTATGPWTDMPTGYSTNIIHYCERPHLYATTYYRRLIYVPYGTYTSTVAVARVEDGPPEAIDAATRRALKDMMLQ